LNVVYAALYSPTELLEQRVNDVGGIKDYLKFAIIQNGHMLGFARSKKRD
jgi:hypothetical protein